MANILNSILKSTLLLFAFTASVFALPRQQTVDSTYVHIRTLGPFSIGQYRTTTVYARIIHVHLRYEDSNGWPDSDTLLTIIDSNGNILYKESAFSTLGSATTTFDCSQIEIPTVGKVLMCTCLDSPDGEPDFQIYIVNSENKFVPITTTVPQYENRLVFLDSRTNERPIQIDSTKPYALPAFEVPLWSGYYEGKIYYKIYSQGFSEGKDRSVFHFDQIPVVVDPLDTAMWRQIQHSENDTISLYSEPTTNQKGISKRIFKPILEFKIFYAVYHHGWWLRVSIDGNSGYLSIRDCAKLGFPETSGAAFELDDDY